MGMYDYIKVECSLLFDHNQIEGWQTHSLECDFIQYIIDETGQLYECMINNRREKVNYTGFLQFESVSESGEYVLYNTEFLKGYIVPSGLKYQARLADWDYLLIPTINRFRIPWLRWLEYRINRFLEDLEEVYTNYRLKKLNPVPDMTKEEFMNLCVEPLRTPINYSGVISDFIDSIEVRTAEDMERALRGIPT